MSSLLGLLLLLLLLGRSLLLDVLNGRVLVFRADLDGRFGLGLDHRHGVGEVLGGAHLALGVVGLHADCQYCALRVRRGRSMP